MNSRALVVLTAAGALVAGVIMGLVDDTAKGRVSAAPEPGVAFAASESEVVHTVLEPDAMQMVSEPHAVHTVPEPDPSHAATSVMLPALDVREIHTGCDSLLSIQNVGDEAAKAAVLVWSAPALSGTGECRGPHAVTCTGVMAPGSTWHVARADLPAGMHSAMVFSFSTDLLAAAGEARATDTTTADALCQAIASPGFLDDCDAYAEFKSSWDSGGSFLDIPMDAAAGGPIAVHVLRNCPGTDTPGARMTSAYVGVGANELGHFDSVIGGHAYHVSRFASDSPRRASAIYAQNAGADTATVELWTQSEVSCDRGELAARFEIDAGNSAVLPAASHRSARGGGPAWLKSSEPLGVIVDEYGRDMLATFAASAPSVTHDAAGRPVIALSRSAAHGALLMDPRYGWETEIDVLNLSADDAAHVRAEFLDSGGRVVDTVTSPICPLGSHRFVLGVSDGLPDERVGSVRVTSSLGPGAPDASAPPIAATAILTKYSDLARSEPLEQMAYELSPEGLSYRATAGDGASGQPAGLDGGVGVVALPAFHKHLDGYGVTSELSIANYVAEPGWTDAAVLLFDQNAMIDTLCRRLNAGEVEYVGLDVMGAIDNGFAAAALVSATYWEHDHDGSHVSPDRSPVGIGAALLTRSRTRRGEDTSGDEAALAIGVPLRALPGAVARSIGNPCAPEPFTRPPTEWRLPTPRPAAQRGQVFLPTMAYIGADARCAADTEVTNTGGDPAKVLLLAWGRPDQCPPSCSSPHVGCSGLIAPGETWSFSNDDLPSSHSLGAVAFSLTAKTLDELGLEPGSDELLADRVCSLLTADSGGPSCDVQIGFRRAYDGGYDFGGLSLADAVGPPIAAVVDRTCPDVQTAGQGNRSRYAALAGTAVFDPDRVDGSYRYSLSSLFADYSEFHTLAYVQNAGTDCASVTLKHRHSGDCLRARGGRVMLLAPGETMFVDPNEYVGPGYRGFLELHSDQPLAVVADIVAADTQLTYQATAGPSPFDIDGDGVVDDRDVHGMASALGSAPGDPNWNVRADLYPDRVVDESDQQELMDNLCGRANPELPEPPQGEARPADQVALPALLQAGGTGEGSVGECDAWVAVQNVGDSDAKAVALIWGPAASDETVCAGPVAVECTGLLRPGRSWHLPTPASVLDASSALLFSFSTATLGDIGVEPGSEAIVADHMCDLLETSVLGDCDAYAEFKAAFDSGGDYKGVPLDHAAGDGLAARTERRCPGNATPSKTAASDYPGIGSTEFGVAEPARGGHAYQVPLVYSDKAEFLSFLYVQNVGSAPADVEISMRAQDSCGPLEGRECSPVTIKPGESVPVDPGPCVGSQWQGTAMLASSQPLAIVVGLGGRDTRFSYAVSPPTRDLDAAGNALQATSRYVLYGPLSFSAEEGWDVGVQVANTSTTRPARARVEFRDDLGAPIFTYEDRICPGGSQTYFHPVGNALGSAAPRVGSVRAESVRLPEQLDEPPAPIAGVVTMFRYANRHRGEILEAAAYNLKTEPTGFDWPVGAEAGGLGSGVGVVAVPDLRIEGAEIGKESALAVANLVPAPGETEVAIIAYDQNGGVKVRCWSIGARDILYADLAALDLPSDFRGSAVISATRWSHEVADPDGGGRRPLVGLSAALVSHDDVSTVPDPLSVSDGAPLRALPWPDGEAVGDLCAEPSTHSITLPYLHKPPPAVLFASGGRLPARLSDRVLHH